MDYISREEILAEYDRQHKGPAGRARKIMETWPAADVAPVRHGRWIIKDKHIYQCNRCGNYLDIRGLNGGRGDANYCPNCGAKVE